MLLLYLTLADLYDCTRAVAMGNMMASTSSGRPVVNTAIRIGNANANAVADVSNSCSLGSITGSTMLIFSDVKCRARRVGMGKRAIVGMILGSTDRLLSRMIIVNCKTIGGDSLADSVSAMGKGRVARAMANGTVSTLRNGVGNIRMADNNNPNTRPGILVHNMAAMGKASPLCMMSNVPMNAGVGFLGDGSVRSVRILGSTSTTTVCKAHTSGNIVLVAAGGKVTKGAGVDFGTSTNFRALSGPGVTGTTRCGRMFGAQCAGSKKASV